MPLAINLTGVKKQVPLPENIWFDGEFATAKDDVSGAGNPIVRYTLKITRGEYEGRTQPGHFNLTGEQALPITLQQLEAIGFDVPHADEDTGVYDDDTWEFDKDDLLGKQVQFRVKHGVNSNNGQDTVNVAGMRLPKAGLEEALS